MLLAEKSSEIFPKDKGYFLQNLLLWTDIFFVALTNKKTVASIIMET